MGAINLNHINIDSIHGVFSLPRGMHEPILQPTQVEANGGVRLIPFESSLNPTSFYGRGKSCGPGPLGLKCMLLLTYFL